MNGGMKRAIEEAIILAGMVGHVFVATADDEGVPHVAVAGQLTHAGDGRVAVSAWFCPATLSNLQMNHHIAIVVWDKSKDTGYQLLGGSERIEGIAMMDGYVPSGEEVRPMPQVEREITMRVTKVTGFTHAIHTDT